MTDMDQACCAHLVVQYKPIELRPGRMQSRWQCAACEHEFTSVSVVQAESERLLPTVQIAREVATKVERERVRGIGESLRVVDARLHPEYEKGWNDSLDRFLSEIYKGGDADNEPDQRSGTDVEQGGGEPDRETASVRRASTTGDPSPFHCPACGSRAEVTSRQHTWPCEFDGDTVGEEEDPTRNVVCTCNPVPSDWICEYGDPSPEPPKCDDPPAAWVEHLADRTAPDAVAELRHWADTVPQFDLEPFDNHEFQSGLRRAAHELSQVTAENATLRANHEQVVKSYNIAMKDRDCAYRSVSRLAGRLAAAREALERIRNVGHNDDCMFCGFKDKEVRAVLDKEVGE